MIVRSLIAVVPYTVIAVNPGMCTTNIARTFKRPNTLEQKMTDLILNSLSRTAEVGARNITTAVVKAQDSHEVRLPSLI
jgi:hypothetical protein